MPKESALTLTKSQITLDDSNKLRQADRAAHDWYRFVLSFPPHLVHHYLDQFGVTSDHLVLDPFCGTGTTLVECKKRGIPSIGIEANPVAAFASQTKLDWQPSPVGLLDHARLVADVALGRLAAQGIEDQSLLPQQLSSSGSLQTLPTELEKLLLTNSISPLPLHKTLILLDCLKAYYDERYYQHEVVALMHALLNGISNLRFGPEVGIGVLKVDAPVIAHWLNRVRVIATDLSVLNTFDLTCSMVHCADARKPGQILAPASIDVVITSPPYPNEKDYTRATRLELVLLGFINSKADLQTLKRELVRSNTRGVYKADSDDQWLSNYPAIEVLAQQIEARRLALGKTSGFERLYARVTRLYFGGMVRHLTNLRPALRPGSQLAYVVGDQASYLGVMIRTGQLLADIAQSLGYEVVDLELFRTRLATATGEQLREEVVLLRWPGATGNG